MTVLNEGIVAVRSAERATMSGSVFVPASTNLSSGMSMPRSMTSQPMPLIDMEICSCPCQRHRPSWFQSRPGQSCPDLSIRGLAQAPQAHGSPLVLAAVCHKGSLHLPRISGLRRQLPTARPRKSASAGLRHLGVQLQRSWRPYPCCRQRSIPPEAQCPPSRTSSVMCHLMASTPLLCPKLPVQVVWLGSDLSTHMVPFVNRGHYAPWLNTVANAM